MKFVLDLFRQNPDRDFIKDSTQRRNKISSRMLFGDSHRQDWIMHKAELTNTLNEVPFITKLNLVQKKEIQSIPCTTTPSGHKNSGRCRQVVIVHKSIVF